MSKERVRALIIGVVVAVCLFGNSGFWSLVHQAREKRHYQKLLTELHADHDRLARELSLVQTDPAYTEYLIRKQLGYVKKGEVEYRLVPPDPNQPAMGRNGQ